MAWGVPVVRKGPGAGAARGAGERVVEGEKGRGDEGRGAGAVVSAGSARKEHLRRGVEVQCGRGKGNRREVCVVRGNFACFGWTHSVATNIYAAMMRVLRIARWGKGRKPHDGQEKRE